MEDEDAQADPSKIRLIIDLNRGDRSLNINFDYYLNQDDPK